jgi:hypothetical protein
MGASTTSRRAPLRDAIDDGQPNLYKADQDKYGGMSFSWTLATPDGKRIVGSKGPCNGRCNSLRAEAAGILPATMFLSILCQYLNVLVLNVVCISDNVKHLEVICTL